MDPRPDFDPALAEAASELAEPAPAPPPPAPSPPLEAPLTEVEVLRFEAINYRFHILSLSERLRAIEAEREQALLETSRRELQEELVALREATCTPHGLDPLTTRIDVQGRRLLAGAQHAPVPVGGAR